MAIHQRHPTLVTFRITPSRLPERLLDHLLGGLLHAGPNALVFRRRPLRGLALVAGRQTAQDLLGRSHLRCHRVDGLYGGHPLGVTLLPTTEPRPKFMLAPLRPFPRPFPQILAPHHHPLAIHREDQDRAGLRRRSPLVALVVERLEVLCRSHDQLFHLPLGHLGPGRLREPVNHLLKGALGRGFRRSTPHLVRIHLHWQVQIRIQGMQAVDPCGSVTGALTRTSPKTVSSPRS